MISWKWSGFDEFVNKLRASPNRMKKAAASALFKEGERIMAKAKPLTPVLTGVLRETGHVQLPVIEGDKISDTFGFGGPAAPYAVYVHENLEAHHLVGQAKFLEQPMLELESGRMNRIAQDIKNDLGNKSFGDEPGMVE